MILLDDLQWADQASTNLLFHLGRRLSNSPILIFGAYRPSEVMTGRPGTDGPMQHPLQPVLNEFARQFGDIELSLSQFSQSQERGFVDALLDSQPNQLGEGFRSALLTKTQAHPLFTVELLRDMQVRGDIIQDKTRV